MLLGMGLISFWNPSIYIPVILFGILLIGTIEYSFKKRKSNISKEEMEKMARKVFLKTCSDFNIKSKDLEELANKKKKEESL